MYLFTVIADYKGGSYVSQFFAKSAKGALKLWVEQFDFHYFSDNAAKIEKKLKEDIILLEKEVVPLNGLYNVWYVQFTIKKKICSLHFVRTEIEP
ncbi:MAG: hypothetical protein ACKVTZ_08115 [Bacteroidia bacterium]